MVEQEFDELEMVHIRFGYGKIAAFDISVIGREVQRRPRAFVGEVYIDAALDQIRGQFVVPVIRSD